MHILGNCPTSHPFAYEDGNSCCATSTDHKGMMLSYNKKSTSPYALKQYCPDKIPCNNKPCKNTCKIAL